MTQDRHILNKSINGRTKPRFSQRTENDLRNHKPSLWAHCFGSINSLKFNPLLSPPCLHGRNIESSLRKDNCKSGIILTIKYNLLGWMCEIIFTSNKHISLAQRLINLEIPVLVQSLKSSNVELG